MVRLPVCLLLAVLLGKAHDRPVRAQTSDSNKNAKIPKEITCSGADLQFELLEDPDLVGKPSPADLAAKGLKLAQKLVGTGVTIVPGSVRLDEGTQPGAGGLGGRRQRQRRDRMLFSGAPPPPGGGWRLWRGYPFSYILQWCQDLWFR